MTPYCVFGIFLVLLTAQPLCRASEPDWTHLSTTTGDLAAADIGNQVGTLVLDVDRDGFNDFVIASYDGMVWYQFDPGTRSWNQYALEHGAAGVRIEAGGDFADIDGDGDLDIVQGSTSSGEIWWWENPWPSLSPISPWTRHVALDVGGQHHDQIFGDFDGDGTEELAFFASGMIIAEIADDPTARWSHTNIGPAGKEGLAKGDVNGDGKLDLVGGGRWYEHISGSTYRVHEVDASYGNSRSAVGDLIPGGHLEIVIGSGDTVGPLNLYQWDGASWLKTTLISSVDHGHALQVADINGDGHLDIFHAEMHSPGAGAQCKTYILYSDGSGGFNITTLSTGIGGHESKVADLDGDGDLDILQKDFSAERRIDIWLNQDTGPAWSLDEWTYMEATNQHSRVFGLAFGDVTGDGRIDIVSGRYVYVNPGGDLTGAWPQVDLGSADALFVIDVDGDALADIVSYNSTGLFWHEAADAGGTTWISRQVGASFGVDHSISSQGYGSGQVIPGGNAELVINPGKLVYFQIPDDPEAGNWPAVIIAASTGGEGVAVVDVDGDGHADIFSRNGGGNAVWRRNPANGTGNWTAYAIGSTPTNIDRVVAADLNGDSRPDMLVSEENLQHSGAGTYWFEQPADPTTVPWTRHLIVSQASTHNLDAADLDADGDIDVVTGEHYGDHRVTVWENDGRGLFSPHAVDANKESHLGTRLVDLDGDGDLEIVSIAWSAPQFIHIWRNDGGGGAATVYLTVAGLAGQVDYTLTLQGVSDLAGNTVVPGTTVLFSFQAIDVTTGLVAHWLLDERDGQTAMDDRGTHHGTLNGPTREAGKLGRALRFDGSNDYVETGTFDVGGTGLTLSAWLRADRFNHLSSYDGRVISKAIGDQEMDHYWMLSTIKVGSAARLRFRLKTNGSTTTLIAPQGDMAADEWIHVAAVYDGSHMILYQNGSEVGRVAKTGLITGNANASVWLGGNPPGASERPFDGLLDDVRVYDRALSPVQISHLAAWQPVASIQEWGITHGVPTLELALDTDQDGVSILAESRFNTNPDSPMTQL